MSNPIVMEQPPTIRMISALSEQLYFLPFIRTISVLQVEMAPSTGTAAMVIRIRMPNLQAGSALPLTTMLVVLMVALVGSRMLAKPVPHWVMALTTC